MLIVEDFRDDAGLLVREFRCGGYSVSSRRVDSPAAIQATMGDQSWDLIICDYSTPYFIGMNVLRVVRSRVLDTPFIFLLGTIAEETAADTCK